MSNELAQTLMDEFADATGISGKAAPRRYLWTDAFAVCNFLTIYRRTGIDHYLRLAQTLVDQVHHILGRHRDDDPRCGWISGLSEQEGEQHPTRGGLRIGKSFNERGAGQPFDSQLEWERDGQYFHYLTKWMHALYSMGRATGERCYQQWAVELAIAAFQGFWRVSTSTGQKQLAWKMSIDLSWPLVPSSGQHDPLDGLVTFLELQAIQPLEPVLMAQLAHVVAETTDMCAQAQWATSDLLGIGGLLDDATRLAQLIFEHGVKRRELFDRILAEAELSLQSIRHSSELYHAAENRLAFRELGLSIGIHGLAILKTLTQRDRELASLIDQLLRFQPVGEDIEAFWSVPAHRLNRTWLEHRDINTVMLASSLAPEGYLKP